MWLLECKGDRAMVSLLLLVMCLVAIWFYSYAIYAAVMFFSRSPSPNSDFHPPISILKPVCGLDSEAYANLASFCQQDYPEYQIIFGVRDATDPAIAVIQQIIQAFPQLDIQLVISDRLIGSNLKISNLANIEPLAHYELLLISDSDIRVEPDYLHRVVQPLQSSTVGVVTCLYRSRVQGAIATLEAIGISTDFHAGVLVAQQLGWMKFAMGSTILIRRQVLAAIGGFAAVADFLADDFMLGNLPSKAGYTVALSDYVVDHCLETQGWSNFLQHQTRWNRCTRASNRSGYLGLIFTHGVTMSLLLALATQGSAMSWMVLSLTWMMRLLMGWIVGVHYLKDAVAQRWLGLIPLRDLLSFGLWVYGLIGNEIVWRSQRFKLTSEGKLVAVSSQTHA
jgi:ceramide glucosyltransferase